jgi:hypothetical protein
MKMEFKIPMFGKMIPVVLDDAKIPALLEQLLPQAAKIANQLKEAGIDTAPILQSFFPQQAKAIASPALSLPPEGSVLDHTGAVVSLSSISQLIKSELEKQQLPTKACTSCLNRNAATGTFNVSNAACLSCYTVAGLPNYRA